MFLDGMRDIGMYYRDPWNLEDVQVLEGPEFHPVRARFDRRHDRTGQQEPSLEGFTDASVSAGTADAQRATA